MKSTTETVNKPVETVEITDRAKTNVTITERVEKVREAAASFRKGNPQIFQPGVYLGKSVVDLREKQITWLRKKAHGGLLPKPPMSDVRREGWRTVKTAQPRSRQANR